MATSRIRIRISKDGLEAHATIRRGPPGDRSDVEQALKAARVVHGVIEAECTRLGFALESEDHKDKNVLLATGTPAGPAADGETELLFERAVQVGTFREDGSLDFHDRNFFTAVSAGEALARRVPPKEGEPGQRVDGKPIDAREGHPASTKLGAGVELDAEGVVRASIAGVVQVKEGQQIDVVDRTEHTGDVDLECGNLRVEGSLCVTGDVTEGFEASASGDVEVKGAVDGGTVIAGGDVLVTGGVIAGHVKAEGGVVTRHAQSADVTAGGILEVRFDAVNSELHGREIVVGKHVLGGSASAERTLTASAAGSPMGVATVLAAAKVEEVDLDETRRSVDESRERRKESRQRGRQGVSEPLGLGGNRNRRASRQVATGRAEAADAAAVLAETLPTIARIEVVTIAHAGVEIHIANRGRTLDSDARAVRFRYDEESESILMEALVP